MTPLCASFEIGAGRSMRDAETEFHLTGIEVDMNKDPLTCSAIVPMYNAASFIIDAIDSLLAQTSPLDKIILVDDGSSDHTVALVQKQYSQQIAAGIILLHLLEKNSGVSNARNQGIALAKTQWILFLDADDKLKEDALELLKRKALELNENPQQPYSFIYPAYETIDANGLVISLPMTGRQIEFNETLGWLLFRNPIIAPSGLLVKRDLLVELQGFDTQLVTSEDWELWLRIAQKSGLGYVDDTLVQVRRHDSNASKIMARMLNSEMLVLKKYPPQQIKQAILKRKCDPDKNLADFISILYRIGEWELGYQEANQALNNGIHSAYLYFYRGLYQLHQKQYQQAIPDFNRCLSHGSLKAAALNNLGAIQLMSNKPQPAIDYFTRALAIHANYLDAKVNMELAKKSSVDGSDEIRFTWRELRPVLTTYKD